MASVRSRAEDLSVSADETVETSPKPCEPSTEDRNEIERESLSQPPLTSLADIISPDQYSQAPTNSTQVASSQQPSPEFLMSLGIKVRDFAYESTLPAIIPVPRVPRQVQPTPRPRKRLQRDWDDKEAQLSSFSPTRPFSGRTGSKKPRSLERKSTEPLQEPVVEHTRTLERIMVKRVYSVITPPPRRTFPATPRTRFSASPPTSPLTPPLSHLESQESEVVRTPSTLPLVVHIEDTSMIPASQLDSESQPHSVLYTAVTLESRSSPGCSPVPNAVEEASPAPLTSPFAEVPSPIKESGADPRLRRGRGRGIAGPTPPSNRYQLRQRPISSSRTPSVSRCSHQTSSAPRSLPLRTRRLR